MSEDITTAEVYRLAQQHAARMADLDRRIDTRVSQETYGSDRRNLDQRVERLERQVAEGLAQIAAKQEASDDKMSARFDTLDARTATSRNLVLGSLVFPLLLLVATLVLTSGFRGTP